MNCVKDEPNMRVFLLAPDSWIIGEILYCLDADLENNYVSSR